MPTIPQTTRAKLDASGETMSGGRYPIRDSVDLANAYKDYVRTGRPGDVAAWIGRRAKVLGLPNPITTPAGDELSAARRHSPNRSA